MNIKNVNLQGSTKDFKVGSEKKALKSQEKQQNPEKSGKIDKAVSYEKSDEAKALENSKELKVKEKTDNSKTIEFLKQESEKRVESFRKMIREMLEKQGFAFNKILGNIVDKDGKTIKPENIKVDEATRLKAKEAISDGGEYSIDAVATRIMDFAKALANGDPKKISKLRSAVKKGFDEARQIFGGKLPEISEKTYDEVMKRFDEWEKVNAKEK